MSKHTKSLKRQLATANAKLATYSNDEQLPVVIPKQSMDSTSSLVSPSGGWNNFSNGFGELTDPTFATTFLPPYEFTFRELTNLYQNPLMKRIVDLHAQDGTRKGFELVSKDNMDNARDIKKEMDERFNWVALGAKMIAMRHLYGGGILFADIDDGRENDEPLNENSVKKVWSFQPVENFYAHPITTRPLFRDDKPGQPMHYQVTLQAFGASQTFKCHESRLIRFPSFESDDVISQNERVRRRTWPFSTTQLVYDGIKRYGIGMQSGSQMLQSFVEDVFKVSNLKSFKDVEGLRTYIREQRLLRNSLKTTVIGENDSLEKMGTPTTGMSEITADQRRDVGMISTIPVPVLFSEESGGLGGSTLSESRKVWFDTVESKQNNQYTPFFMQMMNIVSLETGWDTDDIQILWNPLQSMSPLEQAELELKVSEKDKNYVEMGANAVDIIDRRWGGGEFSPATPDFDRDEFERELEEMEEAEEEQNRMQLEALQMEEQPPDPEPEPEKPQPNTASTDDQEFILRFE